MSTAVIIVPDAAFLSSPPFAPTRVPEFFTAQINNDHTLKAYLNTTFRRVVRNA